MSKELKLTILMIIMIGLFLFSIVTFFPPVWSLLSPRAPRPEIRRGEFAFRLEYEIDGELIVIEDTVIAEHGGTSWDAGIGNHNVWTERLLSDNIEIIELYRSETEVVFIRILGILRGNYLLALSSIREDLHIDLPSVTRLDLNDEGSVNSWQKEQMLTFFSNENEPNWRAFGGARWQIDEEELLNTYGIRLISFEYDPPIVNRFR